MFLKRYYKTDLKCQTQKMETQNTYTTILENESVTVSALLCAETLKIKVKVNDETNEHFGSVFSAEVTEKQRKENSNDRFQSLQQILEKRQNSQSEFGKGNSDSFGNNSYETIVHFVGNRTHERGKNNLIKCLTKSIKSFVIDL